MQHPRLSEAFSLHPLTPDERATGLSMLSRDPTGRLTPVPTHHFGDFGDLTGFRYDCSSTAPGSCLPVSRRMFFGHTMAECAEGSEDILRLMSDREGNRAAMLKFLEGVDGDCRPALLDCAPDNSDAITGHGYVQVSQKKKMSGCLVGSMNAPVAQG